MVRIFSVEEVNRLRSFVETRTDNWEDFLNDDEIALLSSRNYQNALWNRCLFTPTIHPKFVQLNIGLADSEFGPIIRQALDLVTLPLLVRIDFWAILHSVTRNDIFISHPSLNTACNERVKLYADHHIDDLISEVNAIHVSGALIDKLIQVLSPENTSGISLKKLVSIQITLMKLDDS